MDRALPENKEHHAMIQLAWPWLLLALPLSWLVYRMVPPAPGLHGAALRAPFYRELATMGKTSPRHGDNGVRLAVGAAWVLLVIAGSRPQLLGEPLAVPVTGRDLILAVDLSGSMEQADFELSGQPITRLGIVKEVASQFIERRDGDRVGLILFGSRAYLQTPLTFDRATVASMLRDSAIGLAGKQTAIGDAVGLALKRLGNDRGSDRVLILLSDGKNTAGAVDPRRAALLARQAGLKVYTIGIGSETTASGTFFGIRVLNPTDTLDEATLRAIAVSTGGAYFRATDTESLEKIYTQLDALEPTARDAETLRPLRELFMWPMSVALVISVWLAAGRVGWPALNVRASQAEKAA